MALPPEPLRELLARATRIVVAKVVDVLETGPKPPAPEHAAKLPRGATGVGYVSARQKVRLAVERDLKGAGASDLVVEKPEAPYLLQSGDGGPFFLEGERIIGRYGPDTHRLAAIEKALGEGE
jgi:hypothetical protein